MTTLPPEGQSPQVPSGQPASDPAMPQAPQPPQVPQVPQAPQPPQQQAPVPPQQPQYQQPQQPQQPPQFQQQPPQAPQYQQPAGGQVPPGGYQQQYAQQPVADPVSNITLNYWLSVFFSWIPALIFFLIEKDKGNRQAYEFHRDNLNFSLLRVIVGLVWIIPYIGWIVGAIGGLVLFVFHIMAAAKAAEAYRTGQKPPFVFNIPLIK